MPFYLQILISFLVGGIFIALQTLVGERVTAFWRGIILTIPSTMAFGLFFIGLVKTPADAADSARLIPAGIGLAYFFALMFALLSRFPLGITIVGSFISWVLAAYLLIQFPPVNFLTSFLLYSFPVFLIAFLIIRKVPHVARLKTYPINLFHIMLRSLFAGSIIALTVFLAKILGNIWGGVFTTFPAVFASTLVIYTNLQGKGVIPSVVHSLFFPGYFGMIVYSLIVLFVFPVVGIWLGTLAAYTGTFVFFLIFYIISSRKVRV